MNILQRILILALALSSIQTVLYWACVKILQIFETNFLLSSQAEITDQILPYVVFIFAFAVFVINILSAVINKKTASIGLTILALIFLLKPFIDKFDYWPSIPFLIMIPTLIIGKFLLDDRIQKKYKAVT